MAAPCLTPGRLVAVDPRTDPRWLALASGPGGSLFTSPPWLRAVCATYGFTPWARLLLDGHGAPVAGFAWVSVADIRGRRLASLPFCDRADPVVPDLAAWQALVAALPTDAGPLTLGCLAPNPCLADPGMVVVGEAAWHATELSGGPERLVPGSGTARRNLAAARRNGLTVRAESGLAAVRSFHRMHVALRKHKYRLLAQPVQLFERVWQEFTVDDGIVTLLALADGEPVAGALFLVWNDVLYYKFGASLAAHLHLRPNDAVSWAGMRWGAERGLRLLDWGRSDLDQPGLLAYKRKWASEERRILTLRSRGAAPPSGEVDGVLTRLTRLLTEPTVPDHVTAEAGALLYRYFC